MILNSNLESTDLFENLGMTRMVENTIKKNWQSYFNDLGTMDFLSDIVRTT